MTFVQKHVKFVYSNTVDKINCSFVMLNEFCYIEPKAFVQIIRSIIQMFLKSFSYNVIDLLTITTGSVTGVFFFGNTI